MNVKGRIIKAGPIVQRTKKDGTGTYNLYLVTIQIGVHKTTRANYQTREFEEVDEPDLLNYGYIGQKADEAAARIHEGDAVFVEIFHRINANGFNEVYINNITPTRPMAAPQPIKAATTPPSQTDDGDELPF